MNHDQQLLFRRGGLALLCVLIIFIIGNTVFYAYLERTGVKQVSDRSVREFAASSPIQCLFLGDSHVNDALNVSLISNTSFVLATPGENALEHYYRLRSVLEDNISVECIVLSIDLHTLAKPDLHSSLYYYYDRMPREEVRAIYGDDYSYLSVMQDVHLRSLGKGSEVLNVLWQRLYTGTRYASFAEEPNRLAQAQDRVKMHFPRKRASEPLTVEYFERTVRLAEEEGISIVYVKYPVTAEYLEAVKQYGIDTDRHYAALLSSLPSHPVLDYQGAYVSHPEYFADQDHLNARGQSVFSLRLRDDLRTLGVIE